ncbi:amino acid ABC transporter permease [Salinisphaera sp. Q1T1-3]|uniref:amino acid ABC transporter permease n=1 Tax=Salinisphaera sp. Q1T1-3 TaxID=2321229 RepID=UPI000E70E889|nr:amino acid ABC transporter permease [Salinisphaera sp. Q1T1-3]RJS92847.1 amino acid ABC transporter permease [Salinisphaera sp. Q1T1-3]
MIYAVIWDNLPYLAEGAAITVALALTLLVIGLVVGTGLGLIQAYAGWPLRLAATLIERFFRAIPAIVLLFLFYYGISVFYNISAFPAAALALGLRSAAYQSQIIRGAIAAVPAGQLAAARAIGMTRAAGIRHVVLPQALRQAIGPWTNEALSELKDTSLAYTIGVVELMRQADYIVSATYGHQLAVYSAAAVVYLALSLAANWALTRADRRLAVPGLSH